VKKRSTATAAGREAARQKTILEVQRQVRAAVTPHALLRLIWENDVDIDVLVDRHARNSDADGYRNPGIQKARIDARVDDLVARLAESEGAEVRGVLDIWYSRYLLAADVGFEMGFAAAMALQKGEA
jgi:hypothetical protein